MDQLEPGAPSLNIAARWRLEGEVSHADLERAFRLIIARHQALRTFFARADGERMQIVEAQVPFLIPMTDLSALGEPEALAEAERIALLEARIPFDLAVPPLLRVSHLRLSGHSSILLVTVHHIICDGWSVGILAREMSEICAALQAGRASELPDLPVSYGDFSTRQANQDARAAVLNDTRFWEHSLRGMKRIELQPDHPRPPVQTANSDSRSLLLDRDLTNGLTDIARANDCTMFMASLATLLTLLHRYTGETDIAIGSQFAGRDEPGLENLVGLFINTVVLRNNLAGNPSFVALLARIRNSVTASIEHQNVAPETLSQNVKGRHDPSRHPLFSVHWACESSFVENAGYAGFRLSVLPSHSTVAICDLDFSMIEHPTGWRVSCEFNTDLFDGKTVTRLLHHFDNILRAVVTNPGQALSTLSVLDAAEHRALVVECNQTAASYPSDMTLPQLFAAQAARTPKAIAVVCGERELTYRELDAASNRLAHDLRRRGVAPASRIGVILDRSTDLMVALLAIMKSGSAYIPLDPTYPAERLAHVFEDSLPSAIITQASLAGNLPPFEVPVIRVDSDSAMIARESDQRPDQGPSPGDLAYVIYTSGSTGRPKGVQIPHRALVNLLWAMRSQPGITARDVLAAVTTISFDLAVPDVFLPLLVGAKVVMAQETDIKSGDALLEMLRRHGVTIMQATPVTWQLLLEAGWRGDPLLKMLCGGEAMPGTLAERLLACGGEVWNMYGPTETTVWSSALRIASGKDPVPIGPPMANTQFYVLDRQGELVPPGAPGELVIGGDGVGLGYFGLPEMTQEKFVPDRFGTDPQRTLYRTGDIVRMVQREAIGYCLEFLGRADHQIKLRGFRIELGDIESALLGHPDVAEAVAVLGQDAAGEAVIWSYVVPRRDAAQQSETLIGALRARLCQSLPGYMHPSAIVVLDALPRTPNGKIDRARLPAPAPMPIKREDMHPVNELEGRVARIWCSVLGMPGVDKTADFFDLGGNSLLAARLLSRIDTEFGHRMSLATLFKAPSIEAQARLLGDGGPREYDFRQVVRLRPNGSKPPLIAIHNTGVYYYRLSSRLGSDQPLTALQLFDPALTHLAPPLRLEDVAAEYVRLIRQVHPMGPYRLIGWCVGGVLAFEVARQLTELKEEVSLLALIDAWAPGYLRRLPRLRALLADHSFRWQFIAADWRRTTSGQQSMGAFLANRTLIKRLLQWLGRPVDHVAPEVAFEARGLSPENYDRWLLGYLEDAAACYEPGSYAGNIMLLCGAQEPRGLFLDPKMGWGAITSGAIDVVVIDGDHFTVFQGQGLEQLATTLSEPRSSWQKVTAGAPL